MTGDALSVLRQISEKLPLPISPQILEELVALARAQRRTRRAAQRQLEDDPLLAHLLVSRKRYRQEAGRKSTKRLDQVISATFMKAQQLGFAGAFDEWRALLAIFPRR